MSNSQMIIREEPMFPSQTPQRSTAIAAAQQSRSISEVQAAMIVAKQFPRDEAAAYARIMQSCQRRTLAESALYSYPKGGSKVTGPSIRLAEVLARAWGNIDFGIVELEQRNGESEMMAYAWDLETNTRQTKIFQVKHERHTRQGATALDDPRDIYELTANQGARRLRACILGVIPGDVVDAAVDRCEETMRSGSREPIADRVRKMVAAFTSEFNVTPAMVEQRLGHKLDSTSETELVSLRKVYQSIRDGMAGVEQFFDRGEQPAQQSEQATLRNRGGKPGTVQIKPEERKIAPAPPEWIADYTSAREKYLARHDGVIPEWLPDEVRDADLAYRLIERLAEE